MDDDVNLTEILLEHKEWVESGCLIGDVRRANLTGENLTGANLYEANLSRADLTRADLTGANLTGATMCGATLDGATLRPGDIGGPGHILCALTDEEWDLIQKKRVGYGA